MPLSTLLSYLFCLYELFDCAVDAILTNIISGKGDYQFIVFLISSFQDSLTFPPLYIYITDKDYIHECIPAEYIT